MDSEIASAPMLSTGFAGLDRLTGGIAARQTYLLYGNVGAGKTTFALGFLAHGLQQGESAVLVTDRPPEAVFKHAETMGAQLEPYCRAGQLLLFEYPADVVKNAARLLEDNRIAEEFRAMLRGQPVQRLVLDPLTPLLAGRNGFQASRARSVTESFSRLGATCLVVVDTPAGGNCIPACREAVQGVMRFEASTAPGHPSTLMIERAPNLEGPERRLPYEIVPGLGMVEQRGRLLPAASHSTAPPQGAARLLGSGKPMAAPYGDEPAYFAHPRDESEARVLLIHSDTGLREELRSALERRCQVGEASGVAGGLAQFGTSAPDLVVLGLEMPGVSGLEVTRKLRQNGWTMPVVMLGHRMRRRSDLVRMLEAGVDLPLQLPVDRRVFLSYVRNLLRRSGPTHVPEVFLAEPQQVMAPYRPRDGVLCTTHLQSFCERLDHAVRDRDEYGAPFVTATLMVSSGRDTLEELSTVATMTARANDIVFLGAKGVAVLLPEADSLDPYYKRFRQRWQRQGEPVLAAAEVGGAVDVVKSTRQFVLDTVGEQQPEAWAAAASGGPVGS